MLKVYPGWYGGKPVVEVADCHRRVSPLTRIKLRTIAVAESLHSGL